MADQVTDGPTGMDIARPLASKLCDALFPMVGRDCCVLANGIFAAVLEARGVNVRVMAVRVVVFNEVWCRMMGDDYHMPTEKESLEWERAGAYAVGLGGKPWEVDAATQEWGGHVVTVVDDRYLLDLTLCQVDGMAPGIRINSIIEVDLGHAYDFGKGEIQIICTDDAGCKVMYQALARVRRHRETVDWAWVNDHRETIIANVMNLMGETIPKPRAASDA